MRSFRGITLRFTLLGWLVTLVTLAVFVTVTVPQQRREFELNLESKARGVAASIKGVAAGAAVSEDYSVIVDQAMQVLAGDEAIDFLVITKSDGFSVVTDHSNWRVETLDESWRSAIRTPSSSIGAVPLFGRRAFHYADPFDYSGIEWGWIHVGLSLDSYDESVRRTYSRTGIVALFCTALSLLVSLLYSRRLVKPIHTLHAAVEKVAQGDLQARAEVRSRDEIEELASKFNDMAQTILARNQILESVGFAAQEFLGAADWNTVAEKVLGNVAVASGASHACVLENAARGDELPCSLRHEWVRPGVTGCPSWEETFRCQVGDPDHWAELLKSRKIVTVNRAAADRGVDDDLRHSLKSFIHVPIFAGDSWWGILGFDDMSREREWGEAERDSLRAVADMIGASIMRRRSQEALLAAKQAAEEANRAKSTFLANMSHELRTPLNAIIGYSELLEETVHEAPADEVGGDLSKIHTAGRHLLTLINDVLDLSKIEAGRMEINYETVLVQDLVDYVVSTVEPMARRRGNRLSVNCAPHLEIEADVTRLRQSLLNLLSNACKFTENGTVTLSVWPVEVQERNWICWQVKDTGIGISAQDRTKLFKAFSQVDSSATRRHGGTGLGLAISQRLCRTMGGDIILESEPGKGSTFSIWLPARADEGVHQPGEIEVAKLGAELAQLGQSLALASAENQGGMS